MIIKIRLTDFRNFKTKLLSFSPEVTVIIGPNASGKTNILESLFVLSTGKSFRARIEEEMVNYDKDIARVKGRITESTEKPTESTDLETVLTRGLIDIGKAAPEKIARKKLSANGVSKRLIDFAGNFKVTLFGPWDLDLVTESPSLRRKFLDT
ncbi:MAG: AAA family ATPase, partial [Patescibacteria group bacterium]